MIKDQITYRSLSLLSESVKQGKEDAWTKTGTAPRFVPFIAYRQYFLTDICPTQEKTAYYFNNF